MSLRALLVLEVHDRLGRLEIAELSGVESSGPIIVTSEITDDGDSAADLSEASAGDA